MSTMQIRQIQNDAKAKIKQAEQAQKRGDKALAKRLRDRASKANQRALKLNAAVKKKLSKKQVGKLFE